MRAAYKSQRNRLRQAFDGRCLAAFFFRTLSISDFGTAIRRLARASKRCASVGSFACFLGMSHIVDTVAGGFSWVSHVCHLPRKGYADLRKKGRPRRAAAGPRRTRSDTSR
jgi:hypothetical protein